MIVLAVVEAEAENQLPMAPMWFGIIALIFFGVLFAITWSFRGAAHRHDPRAFVPHDHSAGGGSTGSGHGAGGH